MSSTNKQMTNLKSAKNITLTLCPQLKLKPIDPKLWAKIKRSIESYFKRNEKKFREMNRRRAQATVKARSIMLD